MSQLRQQTELNLQVRRRTAKKAYTEKSALNEYKQLCCENGYFLTAKQLLAAGWGTLARFINVEIGFHEIRRRCRLKLTLDKEAKKVAALERQEKAVNEHLRLCKIEGRFLTHKELKTGGFKYLVGVIKRNFSMNELKDRSKLDFFQRKSFTKDEVIALYKKLCQNKGYFLTASALVNIGHLDLVIIQAVPDRY